MSEERTHNKSKEELVKEMQEKQQVDQMMEHQKKIQEILLNQFLPILQKETPKLLLAGKMSNQLNQILQQQIQKFLSLVKVSQVEIPKFLNETIEKNPKAADQLNPFIHIIEACGDLTVVELSEVIQAFGQSANLQAEKLVGEVNLEDCYSVLKQNENDSNK